MSLPPLDEFVRRAHDWLSSECPRAAADRGLNDVAVFHSLPHDRERALISGAGEWQRRKMDAGYGAIAWAPKFGGAGLTPAHARAFTAAEAQYATPADHELRRITVNLVAPTVRDWGTEQQRERFVRPFLRCEEFVCQLYSEPGAGSDLAGLATRAAADGSDWVINGAKIWVSGAQFADWGFLLARTDPDQPKHRGITAFLLPMNVEGIEVRPIRQMTGGASFNEVFLTDVRLADEFRLGAPGEGWRVATSMLAFERSQSGSRAGVGASAEQLLQLARRSTRIDPAVRDQVVRAYVHERTRMLTRQRADERSLHSTAPGPEGSMGKLLWVQGLQAIGDAAAAVLGPRIVADDGGPGTYAWSEHLLGAPGFRIAGGSDEIQRNILAERVLGLPAEPGPARSLPWRDQRRI
ncbi:acyl-CoA dehydrogenase family protein [Sporichthya brevicatena]|uniref:Acyl-CoA dehydrogenase family protein n=1 Tax=Sporichthya brevicatena TaxID=171442 RepID=A0ABN1H4G6_9ACTN